MIRRSVAAMEAYTPGEQPGPGVIKLNTNENPYPPSPQVLATLQSFDADALRRYSSPTAAPLRACIAELHGCDASQVFAGNGSDEVLALCTRAFVENDGSIGYFVPSYSLYPVLAAIRDVEQRPVRLAVDGGWMDPPDDAGSLFFLTSPNAPSGRQFAHGTVAAFCERGRGVVVIDEAYVDFAAVNCLDLALRHPHVLVTRSLSKSYSLAGLRVGYAVGHPELIRALDTIKDSYNLSALSQALAVAALRDQAHMRANRDRILVTRRHLVKALEALGFAVSPSETNFVWARPPHGEAEALFLALRARGIFIRYFPGELTGSHIRISVGTDAEIEALITALRDNV